MGHDVFISFSSKDSDTANKIYDGLLNRGIKCWISSRDVPPGGNYQNEIVSALRSASVMVLVFSRNANSSGEIQKELALAGQYQLTVIPIKIDDVTPSGGFVYSLATSQWVEIFPNIEKNLDIVVTTINSITERLGKFSLEVREAIEDDGIIGPTEQKYLEEEAVRSGLSIDKARLIIREVIGSSSQTNVAERENDYLKVIAEVLEDGKVSNIEKKLLASRARSLGITEPRAEILLQQEMTKLNLATPCAPNNSQSSLSINQETSSTTGANPERQEIVDPPLVAAVPPPAAKLVEESPSSAIIRSEKPCNEGSSNTNDNAWDYYRLGAMTVAEVLASPQRDDLASYLAFYVLGDEYRYKKVLNKLNTLDSNLAIKDALQEYSRLLDPDEIGNLSVSEARAWSLAQVISNVVKDADITTVLRVLDETHGKTRLIRAFSELWPSNTLQEEEDDQYKRLDYVSLGELKVSEILSRTDSESLISEIQQITDWSKQTIKKRLNSASSDELVKNVIKNYQYLYDPDELAQVNVAFARRYRLESVISQAFAISELSLISQIIENTNGHMLLKKAFAAYWPKS